MIKDWNDLPRARPKINFDEESDELLDRIGALETENKKLRKALEKIANLTVDMPAPYGDEKTWYKDRVYKVIGIAARAFLTRTEGGPDG